MKKLSIILAMAFAMLLAGCGDNGRYDNVPPSQRNAVREAEEQYPILKEGSPDVPAKDNKVTKEEGEKYFSPKESRERNKQENQR